MACLCFWQKHFPSFLPPKIYTHLKACVCTHIHTLIFGHNLNIQSHTHTTVKLLWVDNNSWKDHINTSSCTWLFSQGCSKVTLKDTNISNTCTHTHCTLQEEAVLSLLMFEANSRDLSGENMISKTLIWYKRNTTSACLGLCLHKACVQPRVEGMCRCSIMCRLSFKEIDTNDWT